ncbi:2Fe-2S iron-sulfur cluster-binding protein [Bacillus songklensis]|uniref:2Fe-2S iron-sulfur cluster-binding protein n=1 Tax=Bacillus songklensis TaxID=1069116 RepID=A0ABV8B4B5_9BACI
MDIVTKRQTMYQVTIDGEAVFCSGDSSVLDAARKNFVRFPYGCCAGGCGMCKMKITAGDYEFGVSSKAVLTDSEREKGYALACKTYPLSDLTVKIVGI